MPVPTKMADIFVTASSNSPAGSESPTSADDYFRAIQSIVRHTEAKGSDIASASTTDLTTATGEFVDITGTTTITAFGTVDSGIKRLLRFTGILTLTHNATSLQLPGSANITTAVGDIAEFISLGSGNWKCTRYVKVDGTPVVNPTIADNAIIARMLSDSANGSPMINGTVVVSVAANSMTLAIKTKAGTDPTSTDPVLITFRSSTLTDGGYYVRRITSALSLVVSSGSTLGTTSATQSTLNLLAIDNAGTVELAIINDQSGAYFDESSLISTTAEGGVGAADSLNVAYSTTARSNVPFRNLSLVTSTQTTAGSWASSPSKLTLITPSYFATRYIQQSATVATTSGAAIDVTGIPSWAKRITILIDDVSTNGSSPLLIQGGSGSIETSGYSSTGSAIQGTAAGATGASIGFQLSNTDGGAVWIRRGVFEMTARGSNAWVGKSILSVTGAPSDRTEFSAGRKTFSGVIDRIRLTTLGGADTFDAGSVTVLWE